MARMPDSARHVTMHGAAALLHGTRHVDKECLDILEFERSAGAGIAGYWDWIQVIIKSAGTRILAHQSIGNLEWEPDQVDMTVNSG